MKFLPPGRKVKIALKSLTEISNHSPGDSASIADLFLSASKELAASDARLYRSVGNHLKRTRDLLESDMDSHDTSSLIHSAGNFAKVMPSFERQTRRSLQELCKINGISGYSRMTKKMMTERLIQMGVKAPPVPLEALTKTELINAINDMERHYRNG